MQRRTTDLKPHPMNRKLYGEEVLPPEFVASIRENGILVPLAVKEDGTIISGHRRWQAALALKMESVPVQVVSYADELDEREAIIEFNRQREKTFSQKMAEAEELEAVERERARRRMLSGKPIAPSGNVSVGSKGETRDKVAAAVGLGSGRTYDKAAKVWEAAKKGDETAKKVVQELDAGKKTVHAAFKELDKRQKQEAKAQAKSLVPPDLPSATDRYRLWVGDICGEVNEIEPASVDAIITDPPYPKEYLHLYETLAVKASMWLKPGGSLVVMVGQSYLPEILAAMTRHMRYQWTLSYLTPGGQAVQLWDRRVNTFWKPLLWFVNGAYEGDWIGDVSKSRVNDNDKRFHQWGQSESGMADIIDRFTYPGQKILDPFLGGGTTGVVAVQMNRLFMGFDIDPRAVETSKRRLAEVSAHVKAG